MTWFETLRAHLVALGQDGNDHAVARLNLDDIRMRFFVTQLADCVAFLAGVDDHDGEFFIDQRIRPVLHLARRVALGVNVADLFQFQRAFQSDRKIDAASEI